MGREYKLNENYRGGYSWFERMAALEAELAAHLENEGDECPLCVAEAKVERLQRLIKEALREWPTSVEFGDWPEAQDWCDRATSAVKESPAE